MGVGERPRTPDFLPSPQSATRTRFRSPTRARPGEFSRQATPRLELRPISRTRSLISRTGHRLGLVAGDIPASNPSARKLEKCQLL